jgi:pyruvate dehydrogenase E1 component alpha subunit
MYRTRAEVQEQFEKNDPLKYFVSRVTESAWLRPEELEAIKAEMAGVIEQAVEGARKAPYPEADELLAGLYVENEVK